ncbi:PLDc N-terminal domain-containing protein [uncultured Corynebacterium sp.]|uniref:PLDc N-terminal domain-containing protein n=1 Tax=uncultured Corynebacterium sp. TaxID=159447 RepID=UPI00344CBE5D
MMLVLSLAATATANDNGGSMVTLIGLVLLIAIPLVIFICALISIVSSSRYTLFGKIIWIVVTFTFPILGPIVWFIWGRNAESLVKN